MTTSRAPLAFYFGAPGRGLFGWYHAGAGTTPRRCGVVLCNPFGVEGVRAHRTYRHLAERLSAAGFPTLRFDFDGTGDSAGDDRDPDRVATWLADVGRAIDELRARSGAAEIALVGLRLGATLAATGAAARGDVQSLVLWDPCPNGGAYVDEVTKLHAVHRMLERRPVPPPGTKEADVHEALGFALTGSTVAALRALDVLGLRARPAEQALIVGARPVAGEGALVAHLDALGTKTAYRHLPGHPFLVTIPQDSVVPTEVLDTIVDFLDRTHPERRTERAVEARVGRPGNREKPLVFGGDRRLFGILTVPAQARGLPGILLLNAGAVPRFGPTRSQVVMARRWAELGFPVLRFDLSGLGDSPPAAGCAENLVFPAAAYDDVKAAIAALKAASGVEHVVLMGLCSGGDHAFQAALRDHEGQIIGAVIINPRTFGVHDLDAITAHQHARYYQKSAADPRSWKKLLRGEVLLTRLAEHVATRARDLLLHEVRSMRRPDTEDVATGLRSLAERGVDVLLLCSEGDPGVDYADAHADMRALDHVEGFRRVDLAGADHVFTDQWAQRRVHEILGDHLASTYLVAAPGEEHENPRVRCSVGESPAPAPHL